MFINIERLIHSVKTAIACLIGFLAVNLVGSKDDQWVVITILVVMCAQIYVGSVMQKAYLRFLGTLLGCLIAATMFLTVGYSNTSIIVTLLLSSFLFSYMATSQENLMYTGTLGAVTTAIIILGDNPTVQFAAQRFFEISIGIFIAALVSQFFIPISARAHLRRAQGETLEQLRNFYEAVLINFSVTSEASYQELDENIVKSILRQRQLAKESKREPLSDPFDVDHFTQTLQAEKEILRAIAAMHHAISLIKNTTTDFISSSHLVSFNQQMIEAFNVIIKTIRGKTDIKPTLSFPDANALQTSIKESISCKENPLLIDSFIFSANMLSNYIQKLAKLYGLTPVIKNN